MKGLSVAGVVAGIIALFLASAALVSAPEGADDVRARQSTVEDEITALRGDVGRASSGAESAAKDAEAVKEALSSLSNRLERLEKTVAEAESRRARASVDEDRVREIVRTALERRPEARGGAEAAGRGGPGGFDMTAVLRERVGLDEEGARKAGAKLTKMTEDIGKIWRENRGGNRDENVKLMRELVAKTEKDLAESLTPEQVAKLKKVRDDLRRRMHSRRGGRGHRPGGGNRPAEGGRPAGEAEKF